MVLKLSQAGALMDALTDLNEKQIALEALKEGMPGCVLFDQGGRIEFETLGPDAVTDLSRTVQEEIDELLGTIDGLGINVDLDAPAEPTGCEPIDELFGTEQEDEVEAEDDDK